METKLLNTEEFVVVRQETNCVYFRGLGKHQKTMLNFVVTGEKLDFWLLYCLRTWSFTSHVAATCYFVFSWKAPEMALTIKQGEHRFTIRGEGAIQDFLKFLS